MNFLCFLFFSRLVSAGAAHVNYDKKYNLKHLCERRNIESTPINMFRNSQLLLHAINMTVKLQNEEQEVIEQLFFVFYFYQNKIIFCQISGLYNKTDNNR